MTKINQIQSIKSKLDNFIFYNVTVSHFTLFLRHYFENICDPTCENLDWKVILVILHQILHNLKNIVKKLGLDLFTTDYVQPYRRHCKSLAQKKEFLKNHS